MNILPNSFEPISLKRLASLNPYVSLPKSGAVDYVPMENIHQGYLDHQTEEISSLPSSLNAFSEGNILLAKVTPCFENGNIAIASNLLTGVGLCSTELFVLRIHSDKILPEYLMLLLQDDQFKKEAKSYMRGTGGLKRIPTDWLMSRKFLIPSLKHQRLIIQAMSSSDSLIQDIQKGFKETLDRLSSYRQSLITRAVTKGLDPNVEMKDSGVEWIGNIPKNWLIPTLSHVCRSMRNGYVGPTDGLFVPDGIKYVQSLHVKNGEIDFSVKEYYVREEWAKTHPKLRKGNLVIVQTGDIGQVGVVRQNLHNSNCHALIICDIKDDICNVDFLSFYFQSKPGKELLLLTKTGLGLPHLNTGKVCYCKVPLPPLEEQKRISIYCSNIERQICKAEKTIRETILKLKEYRSSLISAAVTGQLVIDEAAE